MIDPSAAPTWEAETMSTSRAHWIPNLIIAGRVALAFVALWMLRAGTPWIGAAGVVLIVVVIALDGLDGWAARRLGVASDAGAVLDITGDRIVEHVFWIGFAVAGQVGLWVPLVVVTRSFLVDAARGMALARGRTAFGPATMMRSGLTRFLTASRLMRSGYGVAKVLAFVLVGATMAARAAVLGPAVLGPLEAAAGLSVVLAVTLCVLRGVPVLVDGRAYLPGGSAGGGAG